MQPNAKLVLASNNAGKLREFAQLLAPLGVSVIPQSELGVPEVEETGLTFIENALLKARAASEYTGLPALADDSGLVVPALGGAPGIHSARYSGVEGDRASRDPANNRKLLDALSGQRDSARDAYYLCVLVLLRHPQDPVPVLCEGRWWGRIAEQPSGSQGFGYDPLFALPDSGRTAAELDAAEKNRLSHRGVASAALLHALQRQPL
jgi:XTP/dITP diphosphohydrolase